LEILLSKSTVGQKEKSNYVFFYGTKFDKFKWCLDHVLMASKFEENKDSARTLDKQ